MSISRAKGLIYKTSKPAMATWEKSDRGVKLTTHLYLAQRLKMSGDIHLLPAYMPSRRGQGQLRVSRFRKIAKSDY